MGVIYTTIKFVCLDSHLRNHGSYVSLYINCVIDDAVESFWQIFLVTRSVDDDVANIQVQDTNPSLDSCDSP
jgi:hypothetical protein